MKKSCLIIVLMAVGQLVAAQTRLSDEQLAIDEKLQLGQLDQAYMAVLNWVADEPQQPTAWYYRGLVAKQLLRQKESLASFRQALELDPNNMLYVNQLSAGYLDAQDYDSCIGWCDTLLMLDPGNRQALIRKAQALQKDARYAEALWGFRQVYETDTLNGYLIRQVGGLYGKLDSVAEAIRWFHLAVQRDSMDKQAYQNLGSLFVRAEMYDEGLPVLTTGISHYPDDPWLYRFRGSLHIMGARFSDAEQDFRLALSCGDSTTFVYRHLGLSLYKQSRYSEALPVYEITTRLDPEDAQAWFYLAYCFKWQVDLERAQQCMERALELSVSEGIASVYSGLAEFHGLQRDYEQAIHHYSRAWEWDQTDPLPLAQIGMLIEQSGGNRKTARTFYESFLEKAGPEQVMLMEYVKNRIQHINEKLFMEGELER